jgi:riboflavin kinase
LPRLIFEGTVFSGKGEGKRFVELPWVKQQIDEKLHFTPFAGTLNLRLSKSFAEKRKTLDSKGGFTVAPEAGYCAGILFRAYVEGLECAVVLPKVPSYPDDVLEIIAPLYLRGKLGLIDGSAVTVIVTF